MSRTIAAMAMGVGMLAGLLGCPHSDENRIVSYHEASFEGGYDVALLQQRVWNKEADCAEIAFEDNEVWIVWSHISQSGDWGDAFEIGAQIGIEEAYLAAAEDGKRVYYSFGDWAEITDRYGNLIAELGEGYRTAAFQPGRNILVIDHDDGLEYIDLNDGDKETLPVTGSEPSFSPDGEALVYLRDGEIRHYLLATDDETSLGEGFRPRFREDGWVYAYLAAGDSGPGLYEVDPAVGTWSYLGDPDPAAVGSDFFRLAPDGEQVLFHDGDGGYVLQPWAGPEDNDWSIASELYCD